MLFFTLWSVPFCAICYYQQKPYILALIAMACATRSVLCSISQHARPLSRPPPDLGLHTNQMQLGKVIGSLWSRYGDAFDLIEQCVRPNQLQVLTRSFNKIPRNFVCLIDVLRYIQEYLTYRDRLSGSFG